VKALLPVVLGLLVLQAAPAAVRAQDADGITVLLRQLEQALGSGDPAAFLALINPAASTDTQQALIADVFRPGVTRVTLRERDRAPLGPGAGEGYRLLIEALIERGPQGRIATWSVDVRRGRAGAEPTTAWGVADLRLVTSVDGLHRLALDTSVEYVVRNLTIRAVDLTLGVESGVAFLARTDDGPTALLVRGRGHMSFAPQPAAERGQIRLFSGEDALTARFDEVYVRMHPADFGDHLETGALKPRPADRGRLRRAEALFDQHVRQSYALALGDLSPETWSLVPSIGDFVAEVHTQKHGMLTYARAGHEAEDVSLFDRRGRRNLSVYASPQKLAMRGPFYDEDDLTGYDVLDYDVDVGFWPERDWIEGRATLKVRVRSWVTTTLTLRLAESLVVRGVSSPELGRLMQLRVVGQNNVIVGLPENVARDTVFSIGVTYSGRLPAQSLEREAIQVEQDRSQPEFPAIPAEPRFIYSNRTYWYPQATVSDYATATLRITIPAGMECVATGELVDAPTLVAGGTNDARGARKRYFFKTTVPVRYLATVLSRFTQVQSAQLHLPGGEVAASPARLGADARAAGGAPASRTVDRLLFSAHANPRLQGRAREMSDRSTAILEYFTSLVGEAPYPSFALAVTEAALPGGHSPAYFALLSEPAPMTPFSWRNDPVSFESFPPFFLAHEIAHQWWGQAVGWKNYHEQWLSEGFAQYFAALYAAHDRGDEAFDDLMRQMQRWALQHSSQGPVYLGYRLGHIKRDSRVFRALVYNKSAVVLHMLRRLVGDEAFFAGVRRFYQESRFDKAGTDDLRRAMEAEAGGRSLDRFFERWIYGSAVPALRFSYRVQPLSEGRTVVLRFEQQGDQLFDVPVAVRLELRNGTTREVIVRVTDKVSETTVPLDAPPRRVHVNRDGGALAEIDR
jgi:hypothetical protein